MVWWQGLLVVIGSAIAGVLVGLLLYYTFLRIKKKLQQSSGNRKREIPNIPNIQRTEPSTELQEVLSKYHDKRAELTRRRETLEVTSDLSRIEKPAALVEIETNLAIATTPWNGKPTPFKTEVWDKNSSEFNLLRAGLQSEITGAYIDMRLANEIVWLLTELGSKNRDVEKSYIKLCGKIAESLQSLMPTLRETDKRLTR